MPLNALVGNFGLALQIIVPVQFHDAAVHLPRNAQVAVLFVNPFIQAIRHAKAGAGFQARHQGRVILRHDQIVRVKDVQIIGLFGKFEGPIAIAKQPQVGRVPPPLAFDAGKISHNLLGVVRRAVVNDDHAARQTGLGRHRLQRFQDKSGAVVNGNDRDDLRLHDSGDN